MVTQLALRANGQALFDMGLGGLKTALIRGYLVHRIGRVFGLRLLIAIERGVPFFLTLMHFALGEKLVALLGSGFGRGEWPEQCARNDNGG
jgi:hypothetical protein